MSLHFFVFFAFIYAMLGVVGVGSIAAAIQPETGGWRWLFVFSATTMFGLQACVIFFGVAVDRAMRKERP